MRLDTSAASIEGEIRAILDLAIETEFQRIHHIRHCDALACRVFRKLPIVALSPCRRARAIDAPSPARFKHLQRLCRRLLKAPAEA